MTLIFSWRSEKRINILGFTSLEVCVVCSVCVKTDHHFREKLILAVACSITLLKPYCCVVLGNSKNFAITVVVLKISQ